MAKICPMDIFLEYLSAEESLLQKMADGESLKDIVRMFEQAYESKEGAKQAALRRLAGEVQAVLKRIFREEGEAYSVPLLELLKQRLLKQRARNHCAKAWWYRRRKDSVFVTVGNRQGAVRKDSAWELNIPNQQVWVSFPDGDGGWFPTSAKS